MLNSIMALGIQVNLLVDNKGNKLSLDSRYIFDGMDKVFVQSPQGVYTADHIKILRFMAVSEPKNIALIKEVNNYMSDIEQIVKYFN